MSFGERLKQRREGMGMTQEKLAALIDEELTRQSISKWETGPAAYPKVEALLCLSVILNISLDELFSDELSYLKRNKEEGPSIVDKYPGLIAGTKALAEALKRMNL